MTGPVGEAASGIKPPTRLRAVYLVVDELVPIPGFFDVRLFHDSLFHNFPLVEELEVLPFVLKAVVPRGLELVGSQTWEFITLRSPSVCDRFVFWPTAIEVVSEKPVGENHVEVVARGWFEASERSDWFLWAWETDVKRPAVRA